MLSRAGEGGGHFASPGMPLDAPVGRYKIKQKNMRL